MIEGDTYFADIKFNTLSQNEIDRKVMASKRIDILEGGYVAGYHRDGKIYITEQK